jgi:hypothetical protein
MSFAEAAASRHPLTLVLHVSAYAPFPALDAFLFDLCVLGIVTSRSSGRVLALPLNVDLRVLVEVPHPNKGINVKPHGGLGMAPLAAAAAFVEGRAEGQRGGAEGDVGSEHGATSVSPCPCETCVATVPGYDPNYGCSCLLTTLRSMNVTEQVVDDAAPFVMPPKFQLTFRVLKA